MWAYGARLIGAVGLASALALPLIQTQSSASQGGVVLPRGTSLSNAGGAATDMTYHGGPVQHDQKVFTIFWNPTSTPFPPGYADTINQFVADLDNSGYYGIASQYFDSIGNIGTHVSFGGTWTDTSTPYPATSLGSQDLFNEVLRAREALGWTWDNDSYVQIYTAPGIGSTLGAVCGVHWFMSPPVGQIVYPNGGCFPGGTTPNETFADAAINVSSHEILETLTDPFGTGWYRGTASGEISDLCNWLFGPRAPDGGNVTLNGHRYILQQQWSNATSSCVLSFGVPIAPVVTQQPRGVNVNTGQTVNLSAVADGTPAPAVQWQASTDNAATFTNIAGATSATYSFTATAADNRKWFHAVFTNSVGSATTDAVMIAVFFPPSISLQPASRTAAEGASVTFSAAASGNPAPTVRWQVRAATASAFTDIAGATAATYTFTAGAADAGKRFRAVFTNAAGTATTTEAALTLTDSLTITQQPASVTASAGARVSFTADAAGTPPPQAAWQYSVDGGSTWYAITGATATTYAFTAAAGDSGRKYRVSFSNATGTRVTQAATLTLTGDLPLAGDLDGDGASEIVTWTAGTWRWLASRGGYDPAAPRTQAWGSAALGDVPLLGDLDGDGKSDLVVWRRSNSTWYWLTSSSGYNPAAARGIQWGKASLGDVPLLADLDGDKMSDLVVWRASTGTWFWITSSSGYSYGAQRQAQWGNASLGDRPLTGDLDGDGRGDLVVWRASTGTWYWLLSSTGFQGASSVQWGSASQLDTPLLRDLDGDGKDDVVVWRALGGTWFWLPSSAGFSYATQRQVQWGTQGDMPIMVEADGDRRGDFAIWRAQSATWYWISSATGYAYPAARGREWPR